tara:strand:+ start:598 stop:885 length:288 start_codon:yes stop_codon:yes gene_type:complete
MSSRADNHGTLVEDRVRLYEEDDGRWYATRKLTVRPEEADKISKVIDENGNDLYIHLNSFNYEFCVIGKTCETSDEAMEAVTSGMQIKTFFKESE